MLVVLGFVLVVLGFVLAVVLGFVLAAVLGFGPPPGLVCERAADSSPWLVANSTFKEYCHRPPMNITAMPVSRPIRKIKITWLPAVNVLRYSRIKRQTSRGGIQQGPRWCPEQSNPASS